MRIWNTLVAMYREWKADYNETYWKLVREEAEGDSFFGMIKEEFSNTPTPALSTMHGGGETICRSFSFRSKSLSS